ncbi:hypothetical protein [Bradyrhizobium canariense]|uniref:Uncharacterized protein n=1 Tax=Bradyrhizobium canariense TaxID=255045 RepID=A0A1H2A919_9BRAD|nr:hypothetical protein [Bradyrhizobium canariense]SDT42377.1 hypothetical protein SAMN05444158_5976 [Bradyrhizobium canariense]
MAALTTSQEFLRISQMLTNLTVSIPIALITASRIDEIETRSANEPTLASLNNELRKKLKAVQGPQDHTSMAQAYEVYAEACFWLEMADRGVRLDRTPGTGQLNQKRPDFVHAHPAGHVYFEVKALEIADPSTRHNQIAYDALDSTADLDARARGPGVHFGNPVEISGPLPGTSLAERLDATIEKITNNVKGDQIHYGPTVLVVDLGRFNTMPYGPSSLLPVFFHDCPPAESCVSGELWQIGFGTPGEQLFSLPEFDGKSNLAGHQTRNGIFREYPGLMAITFVHPRWNQKSELLTLWNVGFDQSVLKNPCGLSESDIDDLLYKFSDGVNDSSNERGWYFRVIPLRP